MKYVVRERLTLTNREEEAVNFIMEFVDMAASEGYMFVSRKALFDAYMSLGYSSDSVFRIAEAVLKFSGEIVEYSGSIDEGIRHNIIGLTELCSDISIVDDNKIYR